MIGVAVVGAGKFGSMFLSRARALPGARVVGVADLDPGRAREALRRVWWSQAEIAATRITDDALGLIAAEGVDVVVDATGSPAAAIAHSLAAFERGRHVVNVSVEADALAGPLLARRAREAGVVYSLAYGDQPALICELVDWARTCGLPVVCAGKGTKYLPAYHESTPETVWEHYGISPEEADRGGMNPQMFNSFLDGTKSAIEMAAVANATALVPQPRGLAFPPCGVDELPSVLRPASDGGVLEHAGTVEVVSSLARDGSPVARDLRWGVFVVFEAEDEYVRRCLAEYGVVTDATGRYAALYRPFHLIGLELGVSVLRAARGEATGAPAEFVADVVAVAKRDLPAGTTLDGEGGYCVYGRLVGARESLARRALPIGLAHRVRVRSDVAAGAGVTRGDVELDRTDPAVRFRDELEASVARSPEQTDARLSRAS